MSTTHRRTLVAVLLLGFASLVPQAVRSQTRSSVVYGLTSPFNSERRSIRFPASSNSISFEGRAYVYSVGGQISIPLNGPLGITSRLLYSQARQEVGADDPGFALWDESSETWRVSSSDQVEFSTESLQLELLADLRIGKRFHLRGGPSFGYRFSSSFPLPNDAVISMKEGVVEGFISNGTVAVVMAPDGVTLTMNHGGKIGSVSIPDEGLVPSRSSFALSGTAGLCFDIPIGADFLLAPEVIVEGLTASLFEGTDETAVRFGVGLSFLRKVNSAEADTFRPASEEAEEIESAVESRRVAEVRPVPLTAAISVSGVGPDASILPYAEIGIYETLRRKDSSGPWEISKEIVQPVLLIDPQYSEAARTWTIRFRYGDTVIAEASSEDEAALSRVNWSIASEADSTHSLVVELTVADSSGASLTAVDRIPIRIRRACRIVEEHEDRIIHTLYPFVTDSDIVDPQNEAVLNEVVTRADKGSRIFVTGLADETEGRTAAREMTGTGAEQVVRILRRGLAEQGKGDIDVGIAPRGVYAEPYRDSLPEGRSVRPHVEIVVSRR